MTACPASCANLAAPSDCEAPCVEGCASDAGHVLSGLESVPYDQCGCTHHSQYYQVPAAGGGGGEGQVTGGLGGGSAGARLRWLGRDSFGRGATAQE